MRRALMSLATLLLLPLAAAAQVVEYYHLDTLGSVRAVTSQSGAIVESHDYKPFGEEWNAPVPRPGEQPVRFTGKDRDTETGLDYFGARYYASKRARFTTVDPVMNVPRSQTDPQAWNRYAYARNSPLVRVDRDGREDFKAEWKAERERLIRLYGYHPLTPEQQRADRRIAQAIFIPLLVLAAPAAIEAGGALLVEASIAGGQCMTSLACRDVVQGAVEAAAGAPPAPAVTTAARSIARGHAFAKHVLQRGEFPGISSTDQFEALIESIISSPSATKPLTRGRTAYWSDPHRTVVILDPANADLGTAFKPTAGRAYFDGLD
jgi:RHS repeat-associated protein